MTTNTWLPIPQWACTTTPTTTCSAPERANCYPDRIQKCQQLPGPQHARAIENTAMHRPLLRLMRSINSTIWLARAQKPSVTSLCWLPLYPWLAFSASLYQSMKRANELANRVMGSSRGRLVWLLILIEEAWALPFGLAMAYSRNGHDDPVALPHRRFWLRFSGRGFC